MSDPFMDFMALANDVSMNDLGQDSVTVKYRPLNVSGDQYLISAIVYRETRKKHFSETAQLQRYDTMNIGIRADSNTAGRITPSLWATVPSEGDSILIVNEAGAEETWYVRDYVDRNNGGLHVLRLATTTKPLGNEWGN